MASENFYFAYGERTPEVMEAIIGRRPDMEAATLPKYVLGVQHAYEMPELVQKILGTNRTSVEMEKFLAYVVMPEPDLEVEGCVAEVSQEELALLDNWDIEGLWLTRHNQREVYVGNRAVFASVHALEIVRVMPAAEYFDSGEFPKFLNDPQRTIEIAQISRHAFLDDIAASNPST